MSDFKGRKKRPFVCLILQCRRVGTTTALCSEPNWQESFELIQDWANRALSDQALKFIVVITLTRHNFLLVNAKQ